MATTFSRSLRALSADRFRRTATWIVAGGVLLLLWGIWFFAARVTLYESTALARVEVEQAAYSIDAPVEGRVVKSTLLLGRDVKAGELLLELDTTIQSLERADEPARLDAIGPQITALDAEITAQEASLQSSLAASKLAHAQDGARSDEANSAAALAGDESGRLARLHAAGHIAEMDYVRARAEEEQRTAAARSLHLEIGRRASQAQSEAADRQVNLERLRGEQARLEGERLTSQATCARLEHEFARPKIFAPVDGRLAAVATLLPGMVVNEGDKLGSILPTGGLKIVADFAPADALGRIRPGQTARLRLDGFPWSQYGSVPATVSTVASETRYGRVRVELTPHAAPDSRIPLQHGLPGTIEIEVEQISPAALLLRVVGRLAGGGSGEGHGG